MWAISMDMSRDDCMKYLRCLELDAYANMVSVLRAQGSLTDDKKRLLEELAKVLHISNERHRAEVRRAVNDEKLSFIADQLNGPNTWADWAIEGRRTIPLLPRLEARTAFTELANSLSLVIAAANEKKASATEKHAEPIINSIKSETDSYKELNVEENLPPKNLSSNCSRSTRGRKRKRSLPESTDTTSNIKINTNIKPSKVDDSDDITCQQQNVPSPLSNNCSKAYEIESIPQTETRQDIVDRSDSISDVMHTASSNAKCRNNSSNIKLNCLSDNNDSETASHANNTAVDVKLHAESQSDRISSVNNDDVLNSDSQIINENSNYDLSCESMDNTQTSSIKIVDKLLNISNLNSTNAIVCNVKQITAINPIGKVVSSGPGPPVSINTTVMTYKKLPLDNFNHQSVTKDTKLNSIKLDDRNDVNDTKLDAKANVIVVQTVPSQNLKISRAGTEVLGKVIVDSKNICLTKPEPTSLTLLPHKSLSNNGDQSINLVPMLNVNSSHLEIVKSNSIVMFDIQQDVPEKSNSLSNCHNNTEMLINENTKTVSSNSDIDHLDDDDTRENLSPSAENMDIIYDETNASCEENELNDACTDEGVEDVQDVEYSIKQDAPYEDILMIADSEGDGESQDMLDAQTEIYNFESSDNICEIQIEETIPEENEVQVFNSPLEEGNINLDNFNYVETEEETIIIRDDEGDSISVVVEELNEFNNTEH